MSTTVVCWLWHGWRGDTYKPEHVIRLRDMVKQHLHMPHTFVCVTDTPVPDVLCVPLPSMPWKQDQQAGIPSCFYKLWAFGITGPCDVISIDLDVIIRDDITDLFANTEQFKVLAGYSSPYNTSLFHIREDAELKWLWSELNEQDAMATVNQRINGRRYSGSDQAYISHKLPGADTWTEADGICQHTVSQPDNWRMMFFAGSVKPWASRQYEALYWGE